MIFFTVKVQTHRVVQILGVLPVNRNHVHVTQIPPPLHIRLGYFLGYPAGLVQNLLRKLHGQLVAPHNGENIHPRVVDMPQDLHHSPFRFAPVRAIVRDLHHHFVASHGSFGLFPGNENILGQPGIVRDHKAIIFLGLFISSHHMPDAPGNDPDHFRLLPPSRLPGQQGNLHRISVKSPFRLSLGNIQILLPAFHFHKAKSLCIAEKGPCQHPAAGLYIFSPGSLLQFSLRQKLSQHFSQRLPLFPGHLQQHCQFLFLHGHISFVSNQLAY